MKRSEYPFFRRTESRALLRARRVGSGEVRPSAGSGNLSVSVPVLRVKDNEGLFARSEVEPRF